MNATMDRGKTPHDDRGLDRLLDAVLSDEGTEALQARIETSCLEALAERRREVWRPARRGFGTKGWSALVGAAALFVAVIRILVEYGPPPSGPGPAGPSIDTPAYLVATVAMAPADRVRTDPAALDDFLMKPSEDDGYLASAEYEVDRVGPEKAAPLDRITDGEILTLLAGASCTLVGDREGSKRVIFANPEDEPNWITRVGG